MLSYISYIFCRINIHVFLTRPSRTIFPFLSHTHTHTNTSVYSCFCSTSRPYTQYKKSLLCLVSSQRTNNILHIVSFSVFFRVPPSSCICSSFTFGFQSVPIVCLYAYFKISKVFDSGKEGYKNLLFSSFVFLPHLHFLSLLLPFYFLTCCMSLLLVRK